VEVTLYEKYELSVGIKVKLIAGEFFLIVVTAYEKSMLGMGISGSRKG